MQLLECNKAKKYIGVSTDDKPASADVPAGSKFLETDSQKVFIYTGSAWVQLTVTNF